MIWHLCQLAKILFGFQIRNSSDNAFFGRLEGIFTGPNKTGQLLQKGRQMRILCSIISAGVNLHKAFPKFPHATFRSVCG